MTAPIGGQSEEDSIYEEAVGHKAAAFKKVAAEGAPAVEAAGAGAIGQFVKHGLDKVRHIFEPARPDSTSKP